MKLQCNQPVEVLGSKLAPIMTIETTLICSITTFISKRNILRKFIALLSSLLIKFSKNFDSIKLFVVILMPYRLLLVENELFHLPMVTRTLTCDGEVGCQTRL